MELPDPLRTGLRDPVSAGSHLLMLVAAVYLTALLLRLARADPVKRLALGVFGGSMCVLYAASALYHALGLPADRRAFYRDLDQSAIYLLIAGTYTPLFAVLVTGRVRRAMLTLIWGLAALGVAAKWLLPAGSYGLPVGLYGGMALAGMAAAPELTRAVGWRGMAWAVGGGLCYAFGATCDLLRRPVLWPGVVGPHEVLHLCDIAGT